MNYTAGRAQSLIDEINATYKPSQKTEYDRAIFDIDNDGIYEVCTMSIGPTSGVFSFYFVAREVGKEISEYSQVISCPQWYDLSFQKGAGGVTRIQGITQGENPETHLFDISVRNGTIYLTENGINIGDIP